MRIANRRRYRKGRSEVLAQGPASPRVQRLLISRDAFPVGANVKIDIYQRDKGQWVHMFGYTTIGGPSLDLSGNPITVDKLEWYKHGENGDPIPYWDTPRQVRVVIDSDVPLDTELDYEWQ